jgi:hypothetical protein
MRLVEGDALAPRLTGGAVFFALASLAFIFTVTAVVTQAASYAFNAPVRGRGLLPFTTSVVLVSDQADRVVLALSAVALLLLMVGTHRDDRRGRVSALLVPGMLALSLSLWVLFGDSFLPLLLVVGGASVLDWIVGSQGLVGEPSRTALLAVVGPCTAIASAIGIAALGRWLVDAADGATPFSDWTWGASLVQLKLSDLIYPFLPRVVLLFLAAWALRLVLSTIWDDVRAASFRALWAFSPGADWGGELIGRKGVAMVLALSLSFSAIVGAYIYAPAINPTSALVGVDVRQFYSEAAQAMFGTSPFAALKYAVANDRTLYLLFQYALGELVGSPGIAVRMMPAVLSVLLTISTYWFMKAATGDGLLSATAALFASFSFQVTVGIDGGLYANWLAMVETFFFFAALLRGLRRESPADLAACSGLSVLILFTHPWTWFAVMGVVVVYAFSSIARSRMSRDVDGLRHELAFLGAVLLTGLAANGAKHFLPTGSGLSTVYGYTLSGFDLSQVPLIVGALESTLTGYLAGALANPPMIVLGIVGVLALSDLRKSPNRLLLSWLATASVGTILSGYSAGFLQSRVIYLIPFQAFGAIGFVSILRFLSAAISGPGGTPSGASKAFVVLAYLVLVCALASYALQTVGYLYQ